MDPLDAIALRESLRSFGVTGVDTKAFYFVSPHPIDEFLGVALEGLTRPVELLVSEQGAPDHFFLTGFSTLPIIFSARYIALSERILRLIDEVYIRDNLCRKLAEGIAFDAMSEFFLLEHNPFMATLCFMKARTAQSNIYFADTRALLGAGTDLWSSEARAVDELYVADMFFGLAHEIGHAIQESNPAGSGNSPWCTDDRIRDYVAGSANQSPGDAGLSYRTVGPSAALDPGRLRHEAGADIEACRILARAASRIIKEHGEPDSTFDLRRLIVGIQTNYLCLAFVSACRRTVIMESFASPDPERALELVQQPIAFAVRQRLLQDHLPVIAGDALGQDGVRLAFGEGERDVARIDPALDQSVRTLWANVFQDLRPYMDEINTGLVAAMSFFNQPMEREDQAAIGRAYRRRAEEGGISLARRQFEGLAQSMALPQSKLSELAGWLDMLQGRSSEG